MVRPLGSTGMTHTPIVPPTSQERVVPCHQLLDDTPAVLKPMRADIGAVPCTRAKQHGTAARSVMDCRVDPQSQVYCS